MRLVIVVAGPADAQHRCEALRPLADARRRGAAVVLVQAPGEPAVPPGLYDRRIEQGHRLGARWNAGARSREGELADVLLFLPAGVGVPDDVDRRILRRLAGSSRPWGALRAGSGARPAARLLLGLAALLRSFVAGVALREQGLFFTRAMYTALGGYDSLDEHEDVEIGLRARMLARPWVLPGPARAGAGAGPSVAWQREAQVWRELVRRYNAPLPSSSP